MRSLERLLAVTLCVRLVPPHPSCNVPSPQPPPASSLPADRTHVLELGSAATVADVKAAIEARQGKRRRRRRPGRGCPLLPCRPSKDPGVR